jgi:hypothetical protein
VELLYDYAASIDVTIEFGELSSLQRIGDYCNHTRVVRIQDGMLYRKTRSVLAHELGHATYRDEPSALEHVNRRMELRADEWAAHFLISEDAYRDATEKFGQHAPSIAQELCVLERLVAAFERTLERVGDTVYINPRMGAGQWSHRLTAL